MVCICKIRSERKIRAFCKALDIPYRWVKKIQEMHRRFHVCNWGGSWS